MVAWELHRRPAMTVGVLLRLGAALAVLALVAAPAYAPRSPPAGNPSAGAHLPVDLAPSSAFVANTGQVGNEAVRLYFDGGNLRIGFAPGAVLYDLHGAERGVLVRTTYEGARPVVPEGRGMVDWRSNYFLGSDPSRWRTGVPSFREVLYEGLYEGVDLRYRIQDGAAKYEFSLAPGVDPGRIRVVYEGAESAVVAPSGDLVVRTAVGEIRDTRPVAHQEGVPLQCRFVLLAADSVTFGCPGRDPRRPLVIDPLVYASYLGGANYDDGRAIATDGAGNAYVAGGTRSLNFPVTPGAYDVTYNMGQFDAFVSKFDADGASLVYSTFLGGLGDDQATAIAVDTSGSVRVAGVTSSTNFPATPGAFDTALNGSSDAFLAALDPTGGSLLFATFLGGDGDDQATALLLDPAGDLVLAGIAGSSDFPVTPGALQGSLRGFSDGFVAAFDATAATLTFATFLGGTGLADVVTAVARDGSGNLYVTGATDAADFPTTPGAFDVVLNGSSDVFVAKIDPAGTALLYGTFVGGQGGPFQGEVGMGIAVDAAGNAYVVGATNTADFPVTPGSLDETYGGLTDGFALKLNATGDGLLYSTFVGGGGEDSVQGVRIDATGRAHLAGFTASGDFPTTPGALDTTLAGPYDAFAAKLDAAGAGMVYSTLLGGDRTDQAFALALDPSDAVYLTGLTNATDFPATAGAYNTSLSGDRDAFVAKLTLAFPITVDATPSGLQLEVDGVPHATPYTFECEPGANHTLGAPSPQTLLQARWAFDSWSDAGSQTHSVVCAAPETYVARYLVTDYLVTVATSPSGLQVLVDGVPGLAPQTFWWAVGSGHTISAPSPQVSGGTRYLFRSWSDAGAQTHAITVVAPFTYRADFATEYEIVLDTVPPALNLRLNGSTVPAPYAFWCGAGTPRTIEAPDPVTPPDLRLTFLSWSDGGAQSHGIVCTAPRTYTATFLVEFQIALATAPAGLNVTVDGLPFTTPYAFWCVNGTGRTLGAPSPQTFGAVRQVFLSWSDGGAQSHGIACTAPTAYVASFAREYEIAIDTIPAALQIEVNGTSYAAPHRLWCREGTDRTIGAPSPQGTGGTRYPFLAWTDGLPRTHAIACDQPRTVTAVFATEHQVTIETSPPGLDIVVNGTPVTTPGTFWWEEGTTHFLNATTPQGPGRTRWAFLAWSDGGAANHSVVATAPRSYTATFAAEHEVALDSSPPGLTVSVDGVPYTLPRAFWWRNGTVHAIAVGSPQGGPAGTRYAFSSWSDGGARNRTVTASGPADLTAAFGTQYLLTATSPHGTPSCDAADCWYDAGRTAALHIDPFVTEPAGVRYVFFAWTGDAGGVTPIIPVLMDAPKSTVASWTTEYFLRVVSPYGNATGEGWYPAGETAAFAVPSGESSYGGTRYRFLGWSGGVNTTAHGGSIVMDGPKMVVAQWEEVAGADLGSWIWVVPAIVAVALVLWFLWMRRGRKATEGEGGTSRGFETGKTGDDEDARGSEGEDSPDLEDEVDLDARAER